MVERIKKLFGVKKPERQESLEKESSYIEMEKKRLDSSMQLLKKTTDEVSIAAVNAAVVLQQRLKDSEYRFYSTIDNIDDLVMIKDYEGRWKMVNRVAQDLYGWIHGEYFGKTDEELMELYPHLALSLRTCIDTDKKAWEVGRSSRTEECVPYGNSIRIFDIIKTPVYNEDGTPKELIIVGRDMTESIEKQRRTKACFQALNSASDGIVIVNNQDRIIFSNDSFNRRFKIDNYNSILNHRIDGVLPWLNAYSQWHHAKENQSVNLMTKEAGGILITPMMNGATKPIYCVFTFKDR